MDMHDDWCIADALDNDEMRRFRREHPIRAWCDEVRILVAECWWRVKDWWRK